MWVNIGSGIDLLPEDTKPLPGQILNYCQLYRFTVSSTVDITQPPVASFIKQVNLQFAKHPLKNNGHLTSLVKEATEEWFCHIQSQWCKYISHDISLPSAFFAVLSSCKNSNPGVCSHIDLKQQAYEDESGTSDRINMLIKDWVVIWNLPKCEEHCINDYIHGLVVDWGISKASLAMEMLQFYTGPSVYTE